jgi:hypothetical protein
VFDTAGILATTVILITACTLVRGGWDASESRQNSFSESEEVALRHLPGSLSVEIHMAPQDARRVQLERSALAKLQRTVPDLKVAYTARTASGLYEQADPGYGEIHYSIGDRRGTSRIVTDEGVLEAIFETAGVKPPADSEAPYNGHPLDVKPTGAALVFYGIWPAAVAGLGYLATRSKT